MFTFTTTMTNLAKKLRDIQMPVERIDRITLIIFSGKQESTITRHDQILVTR